QGSGDLVAVAVLDPEEGETSAVLGGQRRDQFHLGMFAQALLEIAVELVNTALDLGLAQLQVQLEGFVQCPAVLEGVVAAGGEAGGEVGVLGEGWDQWCDVLELLAARADDSGAAR